MYSTDSIRSVLIIRTLKSITRKRLIRIEAARACSNKLDKPFDKPSDPIAIFSDDLIKQTPPEPKIYTQGYPAMRKVDPYERDLSQYESLQPHDRFQCELPQNLTGFPQNISGFPQNMAEFTKDGECRYLGHCCYGVCSGGKPPCYPTQARVPPRVSSPQCPCYPPQPCPCCCQNPCCCSRCGPCAPHGNWCMPRVDCCGRRIVPPPECRPGPVPPNPCCPQYPKKGVFKLYRSLFFFVCVPVIILQLLNVLSHEPCPKIPCRDYEYMRIRSKRFPWGEGVESFFHNEEVNHLPGECEPPPMICEP